MRSSLRFLAAALLAAACSDDPAADPALLARTDSEPAGANCAHGGTAVRTGLDDDGDGILGNGEVDEVSYVCAPAPVPTTVSRSRAEPAGEHCPSGGTAVEIGPDRNGNGNLDDDEVASTTYACVLGEVWEGDASVSAATEPVTLARLREATVVTGNLTVSGPVSLPRLRTVVGAVIGWGDGLDLPALATVGGDLDLEEMRPTGALELPALTAVSADLRLPSGPELERVSLPALTTVGGGLFAIWWSDATVLEARALRTIGGTLFATRAPQIAEQLPGLETVGGDIDVGINEIDSAYFPALATVGGALGLHSDKLAHVYLPVLASVGAIHVESPLLIELRLPRLATVAGALSVRGSTLVSLDLPALVSAGSADRADLQGISIARTALREVHLPALREAPSGIDITQGSRLSAVRLPALVDTRHLNIIVNPYLARVEAPTISTLEYLNLDGPLTAVAFDELTTIRDRLGIDGTSLVDMTGFPKLASVHNLRLADNAELESLDGLGALRTVNALMLEDNEELASLEALAGVTAVRLRLAITSNEALATLEGLHNVATAGEVLVEFNGITSLDGLRALAVVTGSLQIVWNAALTSLAGLDRLSSVGDDLDIEDNALLPAAEVAALKARLGF
jgi:hypothetical protein